MVFHTLTTLIRFFPPIPVRSDRHLILGRVPPSNIPHGCKAMGRGFGTRFANLFSPPVGFGGALRSWLKCAVAVRSCLRA
jgi:hypothetical protein